MGVIVTSTLMQSSSAYTGNVHKIVVVHTLPGYQPDPSYFGRGNVVATYCG